MTVTQDNNQTAIHLIQHKFPSLGTVKNNNHESKLLMKKFLMKVHSCTCVSYL